MADTSTPETPETPVPKRGVPAPPVVYLPVRLDEHGAVADFLMVRLADERVALLGYTALDRFIDCCGEQQPWVLFETSKLGDLHAAKPFDLKLLDVPLPDGVRSAMEVGG